MKTLTSLTVGLLFAGMTITGNVAFAASTSELLQQGLYAEEVEGNVDAAIKAYDQVIRNTSAPPNQVAQALYRQGMCYLKIKDEAAARGALEKLVADYPSQTEIIEKARPVLNELTDFDPASLMPPETLVYVEFGTPGRQVETILNTLKGTPFENPLAALAGQNGKSGQGTDQQKTPGDIVGALLNPSMMAEFKKIRGCAFGITGIEQNNPPMVSVLYPGKSDALRGLILAGLGMAGTAGEPLEGMQTVNIKDYGAVAYDDTVIIVAHPGDQLARCVKQYKGLHAEPSLASNNKAFAKLSKTQRQKNLITIWAKVDEAYGQLLKLFRADQVPGGILTANAVMDFTNIDEFVLTDSVETNGVGTQLELQFKDGHHCLAYDLIRTPNIGRAALAAVPAGAIGVASFSLGQSTGQQADQVRAKIQNYTGLDVGREIFANVEQLALFAMPAPGDSATKVFLPGQLGLAITSRDPEQTRQILTTLLGTIAGTQPGATPGQYKISKAGQPERYCYVDQVAGTTLISLNGQVVDAAAAALKNHESICTAGPLVRAVQELTPATSKLVLLNAGGAIRLLGPQLDAGEPDQEVAAQLKTNLDQLARAADGTTLELRTDEQPNDFSLNSGVTGLPPLNEILGPVMQIQHLSQQAREETAARQLREATPVTIRPAAQAPALDGQVDDHWSAAQSWKLDKVLKQWNQSSNHLAAEYKALWDEANLYVLVDVTDGILRHDPGIAWYNNDGIEIYLDADNGKAAAYGQNDFAYAFLWDATAPAMKENFHNGTNGVKYALVTTDKGYRLVAAFPWTTLGVKPSAGAKIGVEVQVNDNEGNAERAGKISWHDGDDRAYQTPQALGNAELGGLIGWWKFDETDGPTAKDSSGHHHDGKLNGSAKWMPGRNGGALALDGKGSFVQIADKSAFDLDGELTIAGWINLHSVTADWMAIVTKGDNAWRFSTLNQESHLHFSVNRSEEKSFVNGSADLGFNKWHHVAAVYQGSAVRLYVDGQPDGESPWTGGIAKSDAEVLVGENAEQPNRGFDGLIEDLRIYNCALSASEIKNLAGGK